MASAGTLSLLVDTTLTEDHDGDIIIAADGITVDCDDRSVTESGSGIGIFLGNQTGVTITTGRYAGQQGTVESDV